ncbi:MAG: RNA polymerase sigma factor [Bacteroidia bacterium]|nr:RNA polymerase sigma factor [Bacteroidia bacterium]NNM22787.1 sigma-70 family RNA polymerase sigma factor [Flavobacteriaceae bacterium]
MTNDLHKDICDKQLFANVYRKYATDLHDFLYYKYGEQFNPDDKTQDAFIKLWENCKKVTPAKAKSYLFTIANNMTLNEIKHQKVVLNYKKTKPKEYTSEDPEFLMEQDEYLKRYQKALAALTEEQRVAFSLSKIEGKKHSEIAEMLGVTKKVVEYRIYSAFDKLKSELQGFKV